MAKIHKQGRDPVMAEVASFAVERLVEHYRAMSAERGRLHVLAFDKNVGEADEVLFLIETPFDDLAGIASQLGRAIKPERFAELSAILGRSPLANQQKLISWLRNEVDCPQVASFLVGADALRLLVVRAFDMPCVVAPGRQTA